MEGLFDLSLEYEVHNFLRTIAMSALTYMEVLLGEDSYGDKFFIFGCQLSIADFYLYSILILLPLVGIDLSSFPQLEAYTSRIASLPEVVGAEARIATNASTTF